MRVAAVAGLRRAGAPPDVSEAPTRRIGAPRRGRVYRILRAYRYPLLVFALSRLATGAVLAIEGWVTRGSGSSAYRFSNFFRELGDWDGIWYRAIAQHGYDPSLMHGNTAAFFPLYPLLLRVTHQLLPWVSLTIEGVLVSTALFAVGLCLLYKLTLELLGERISRRAVVYIAISPLAFIFSAIYAESLFLLLAVGTFLLIERGRWLSAGIVGMLAVLARPVGIMLAPALVWRAWRDSNGRLDWRFAGRIACVALLPLAEVGFFLYLWWRTGDPLASTDAQSRGWGRGAGFPPLLVWHTFTSQVLFAHRLRAAVSIAFTLLWLGLAVALFRRRRVPTEYALFGAGVVLLPFSAGSLISSGRLGLMGFPLFWGLAILGQREGVDTAVKILFPTVMAALIFVAYGFGVYTP